MPPPPKSSAPRTIRFQPNAMWESESEMTKWIEMNIKGATVVKRWTVQMICCEVVAPVPVATKKEKEKHV